MLQLPVSSRLLRRKKKFRMHWRVVLTHFPISAFLGVFIFTSLHFNPRRAPRICRPICRPNTW